MAIALLPGRLWPNTPSGAPIEIEIFGATGEHWSGKTVLGLSIAPGVHPEGHPYAGKPRTLVLDYEKSSGTYGGTGAQRIDVPTVMMSRVTARPYTPLDVFVWFMELLERLQPQQFDVIMADPVTDLEDGLTEWVRENCGRFNLTRNQIDRSPGLLWGAVKTRWKQVLLQLSTRCKCFYFTTHLRAVWAGNSPTSKKEPKGKETLMELASLYLWLERRADAEGNVPAQPSGIVLKQRLADTVIREDGTLEVINLMPPRLPVATVAEIRRYIANPPDYHRLSAEERVIEEKISEEQILQMRLEIAQAERDVELARAARVQTAESASPPPVAPDPEELDLRRRKLNTAEALRRTAVEVKTLTEGKSNGAQWAEPERATAEQIAVARRLYVLAGIPGGDMAGVFERWGAKISEMTRVQCEEFLAWLGNLADIQSLVERLGVKDQVERHLAQHRVPHLWHLDAAQAASMLQRLYEIQKEREAGTSDAA
jgi:hypothetical protein